MIKAKLIKNKANSVKVILKDELLCYFRLRMSFTFELSIFKVHLIFSHQEISSKKISNIV